MRRSSHVRRSYAQYCALARAFDVIGERWTALLVRELSLGPKRYADLLEGLPGIGTSLLAARLKQLEAAGVVRQRQLPPPAARNVYELTDDGVELADAFGPLVRWGAKRMGRRSAGETFRPEWFLLYLRSAADREAARGVHDAYEFRVDGDVLHVLVDDGDVDAHAGPSPRPPDLIVDTDLDTFVAVGTGELDASDPKVVKKMNVEGDPGAARRCLAIFAQI